MDFEINHVRWGAYLYLLDNMLNRILKVLFNNITLDGLREIFFPSAIFMVTFYSYLQPIRSHLVLFFFHFFGMELYKLPTAIST